jgi:hypothetical protein
LSSVLVRIIKDWDYPDIFQQTPGHSGEWDGIRFTTEPVERCDYVIVCNRVPQDTVVHCPPEHIWAIIQEPPEPEYRWLQQGFGPMYKVYTQDTALQGEEYVYSHPALPWHVLQSYDWLKNCPPPEKPEKLSWITSNRTRRPGHQMRMDFLDRLRAEVDFDLWGRGFRPLENKWDGLARYRFTLAIENHSGPYYWTEKLADALLAWSLPIYFGCTNITEYLPAEATIPINITRPAEAIAIIREAIESDLWRRDAIAQARELILDRYQFFPYMTTLVTQWEASGASSAPRRQFLNMLPRPGALIRRRWLLGRVLSRVRRLANHG